MTNPWLFDSDQLDFTPSFKDGISHSREAELRVDGVKFINRLGSQELDLYYGTTATASTFFHRFYMFHSFAMFPVYPLAATALFLAGKVEETPKKSSDIVRFSRSTLSEHEFSQFGTDPKEEILTLERILLQTLRFDLEVEHPYKHLLGYTNNSTIVRDGLGGEEIRLACLQRAWAFLNDSCCTTVCLQYEPEIVAIAMLLLACKTGQFGVADWENRNSRHRYWWDAYVENLEESTLEDICHQVLDVYQISTSTTRNEPAPETKVPVIANRL